MSYVEDALGPGEHVAYEARLSWTVYLPGLVLLPFGVGAILLVFEWIARSTTEMAVTNERVIMKTGLITRKTLELRLSKVETVGVAQGVLGRMLNYGTIRVVGTGGSREVFTWVDEPLEFRRAVQELLPE